MPTLLFLRLDVFLFEKDERNFVLCRYFWKKRMEGLAGGEASGARGAIFKQVCSFYKVYQSSVADPDPHGSVSKWSLWIRICIRDADSRSCSSSN